MLKIALAAARAQLQQTSRDVEDFLPLVMMPLFTLAFMAILEFLGRRDLTGYAIVAPLLMTVGQMGIFVASEMITRERSGQTLELLVATPAPFPLVVVSRITSLSAIGLVGFVESWLIARFVFDASITIHHPALMAFTLLLTVLGATTTALIAAAIFCFSRSTRTLQNSVSYPLFAISGVLVPVTYLPDWIEPFSRISFLYWSANLLRDSLASPSPSDVLLRLFVLAGLSLATGIVGMLMVNRMIIHLRKDGTLGL